MATRRRSRRSRTKPQLSAPATRIWLKSKVELFKVQLLFALFLLVAYSLLVTEWGSQFVMLPMNKCAAVVSAWFMRLLGVDAQSIGTAIFSSSGSVSIKEGCNGVHGMVIFVAGVIAFPTDWRKKLIGVLFITIGIFFVNVVRVITLLYLLNYYPSLFQEAHSYLWQFAIIIVGTLLWIIWYDQIARKRADTANL